MLQYFTGIFARTLCVWNITIGLYQVAHECGHSKAPVPKLQKEKCTQDQQPLQSASPPKDEYLEETQPRQNLIIEDDSSLLAPLTTNETECKETYPMTERLESTAETTPEGNTLISQVMPLLDTTPSENTQIQHWDRAEEYQTYWALEFTKGMWTLHCKHWMA